MEPNVFLISIPAIVALVFKGGIYAYAHYSQTHNHLTRLYLYSLFALSIQNIAEIWHFYTLHTGVIPYFEVNVFYASSIVALALFVHLATSLALGHVSSSTRRSLPIFFYLYAAILLMLLIFTPLLIKGYEPFGYSVTRIPGPLYFIFEAYVAFGSLVVITLLVYGSFYQRTPKERARNTIVLLAILPMALLVVAVIVLLHLDIRWFNASVTNPIAITFFLVITAYAIHRHRIFDIQFFIPWSKLRKRKIAFYRRVRSLITELVRLKSTRQIVVRVAEALACPVVLVTDNKTVSAATDKSSRIRSFPKNMLRRFDRMVVANEIMDSDLGMHGIMARHGVAAIVPYYPNSKHGSGWLLLGDSFNEHVYTPLDFRVVEELFDKLAGLFLEIILAIPTRLIRANRENETLKRKTETLRLERSQLEVENQELRGINTTLIKERPVDSLSTVMPASDNQIAASIALLGRDGRMLKLLRQHFVEVASFVGAGSTAFKRQPIPNVLVCNLERTGHKFADRQLLTVLSSNKGKTVAALYGPYAGEFAAAHRQDLLGGLIEVIPGSLSLEAFIRRIRALAYLSKAVYALPYADQPLIGRSAVTSQFMQDVTRAASFNEPVWLEYDDVGQGIAVASYMHELRRASGKFEVLRRDGNWRSRLDNEGLLACCENGTLMIDNFCAIPPEVQDVFLYTMYLFQLAGNRLPLILGCQLSHKKSARPATTDSVIERRPRLFTLRVPGIQDRKSDIPLLIHYFTLQFNLQAASFQYLSQSDVDRLLNVHHPKDLIILKQAVFQALQLKLQESANSIDPVCPAISGEQAKSLDELVSAYEAGLIEQTLLRCNGNKSKTARLLRLRPNTLHYKLERHGLSKSRKKAGSRK